MNTASSAGRILTATKKIEIEKNRNDILDLGKRFSYGKQSDTQNLVDEHAKAVQLNLQITNTTDNTHTIAIGGISTTLNLTQFPNSAAATSALSATAMLKNGVIVNDGVGKTLEASLTDAGLSLEALINYIANTPSRLVGMSIVSRNATTGDGDSSNYDLKMTTNWVSPFDVPVKKELNLRPLVVTGANFTQERLNINFIKQAFPVILSNEHFLNLQIVPNTKMTITLYFGAQDSKAQRFWRAMKDADEVIRPELIRQEF